MRDAHDGCKYTVRVQGDVTLLDPVRPGGTGTQIVPRDLTLDADVQYLDGARGTVTRHLSSSESIARSPLAPTTTGDRATQPSYSRAGTRSTVYAAPSDRSALLVNRRAR